MVFFCNYGEHDQFIAYLEPSHLLFYNLDSSVVNIAIIALHVPFIKTI